MIDSMRVRVLASLVIGSLAASGASFAEEPVHSFACDTPPGHFSDWTQSLSPGPVEITGTLTVNELRTDTKWSPVAGVMLDGGADGRTSFGVRLLANLTVNTSPSTISQIRRSSVVPRAMTSAASNTPTPAMMRRSPWRRADLSSACVAPQ